jgi:hypothetical protein
MDWIGSVCERVWADTVSSYLREQRQPTELLGVVNDRCCHQIVPSRFLLGVKLAILILLPFVFGLDE